QARRHRPHQVPFARRPQARHRLQPDRHRQRADRARGAHGERRAAGRRLGAPRAAHGRRPRRARGAAHGQPAARCQRAVHDDHGDQDAFRRPRVEFFALGRVFMNRFVAFAIASLVAPALVHAQLSYPEARKSDVVEEQFGVRVSDPYRWMEDASSSELAGWITRQNELSAGYLQRLPLREHFQKRLTELWNYSKTSAPLVENGHLFYRRNNGLELQSSIYLRKAIDAPPA